MARPSPAPDWSLVMQHTGLAYSQARLLYHQRAGIRELGSEDDVAQEALLALVKACAHFDPSRGLKFSTFAVTVIRRYLANAARKAMLVRLPDVKRRLRTQDGRSVKDGLLPLLDDLVERSSTSGPGAALDQEETAQAVQDAVARLDEHQCWVVRRRWGLDGMPPEDCRALGVRAGVGKAAISGRCSAAREKLRPLLRRLVEG